MKNKMYTAPLANITVFESEYIMDIISVSGGEGLLVDCTDWNSIGITY